MKSLHDILKGVAEGKISLQNAEKEIKVDYLNGIDGMAQLDFTRQSRTGIPEVIFSESKTVHSLVEISKKFLEQNGYALLSRVTPNQRDIIQKTFSSDFYSDILIHENNKARTIILEKKGNQFPVPSEDSKVGIITAGTSDIPIAEEAKVFLEVMGIKVVSSYDVGIAGFHRIFKPLAEMVNANVKTIIVVAGMEGTLPGVVSALVDIPVIGVPTSTGYGLGEKGIGALTTMLQSCSPGLAVVNIDNGFGAACMAALISKKR